MTKMYHCDAPDCTFRPRGHEGLMLTYSRDERFSSERVTDDFHFCNAKCMVAFMHATKVQRGDGYYVGDSVRWPGKSEDAAHNA